MREKKSEMRNFYNTSKIYVNLEQFKEMKRKEKSLWRERDRYKNILTDLLRTFS